MANRDSFTMPLLTVAHVIFPGVISELEFHPASMGQSARRAMEQDRSLVMALELENHEPITTIATTARILEMQSQRDGWRMIVVGIQRVYILQYRHQGTSLIGQFRYVSDSEDSVAPILVQEAWALASELWALVESPHHNLGLPQDAALLSYWIAAHVPLSATTQQELLEISTTRSRLAKEVSLMRTLIEGLRAEHHR